MSERDGEGEEPRRPRDPEPGEHRRWTIDLWRAGAGGLVGGGLITATFWFLGSVRAWEAAQLLATILETLPYFCSAVVGATATILALMLTVLSLSAQTNVQLSEFHYRRIRNIARLDAIVFVFTIVFFVFIGMPYDEADGFPKHALTWVLYAVIVCSSLITGVMITVVLSLYQTVSETIEVVGLGREHPHMVHVERDDDDD